MNATARKKEEIPQAPWWCQGAQPMHIVDAREHHIQLDDGHGQFLDFHPSGDGWSVHYKRIHSDRESDEGTRIASAAQIRVLLGGETPVLSDEEKRLAASYEADVVFKKIGVREGDFACIPGHSDGGAQISIRITDELRHIINAFMR